MMALAANPIAEQAITSKTVRTTVKMTAASPAHATHEMGLFQP
jgi:hypothetical protein